MSGADINVQDLDLKPIAFGSGGGAEAELKVALHRACFHQSLPEVKRLVAAGAINKYTVNDQDLDGSPLMWTVRGKADTAAADANLAEITKVLLSFGAVVNVKQKNTESPLHLACIDGGGVGKPLTVRALLRAGADVDQRDKNFRMTPLHWAIVCGHLSVVQELIEGGASVITRDKRKSSGVDTAHDRLDRMRKGDGVYWSMSAEERAEGMVELQAVVDAVEAAAGPQRLEKAAHRKEKEERALGKELERAIARGGRGKGGRALPSGGDADDDDDADGPEVREVAPAAAPAGGAAEAPGLEIEENLLEENVARP